MITKIQQTSYQNKENVNVIKDNVIEKVKNISKEPLQEHESIENSSPLKSVAKLDQTDFDPLHLDPVAQNYKRIFTALNECPASDRLHLYNEPLVNGQKVRLMRHAVEHFSEEQVLLLLACFPDEDRVHLFPTISEGGDRYSFLGYALMKKKWSSLSIQKCLNYLPADQRPTLLLNSRVTIDGIRDEVRFTSLALHHEWKLVDFLNILSTVAKEKRSGLFDTLFCDEQEVGFISMALRQGWRIEACQQLIQMLPVEDRIALFPQLNENDRLTAAFFDLVTQLPAADVLTLVATLSLTAKQQGVKECLDRHRTIFFILLQNRWSCEQVLQLFEGLDFSKGQLSFPTTHCQIKEMCYPFFAYALIKGWRGEDLVRMIKTLHIPMEKTRLLPPYQKVVGDTFHSFYQFAYARKWPLNELYTLLKGLPSQEKIGILNNFSLDAKKKLISFLAFGLVRHWDPTTVLNFLELVPPKDRVSLLSRVATADHCDYNFLTLTLRQQWPVEKVLELVAMIPQNRRLELFSPSFETIPEQGIKITSVPSYAVHKGWSKTDVLRLIHLVDAKERVYTFDRMQDDRRNLPFLSYAYQKGWTLDDLVEALKSLPIEDRFLCLGPLELATTSSHFSTWLETEEKGATAKLQQLLLKEDAEAFANPSTI